MAEITRREALGKMVRSGVSILFAPKIFQRESLERGSHPPNWQKVFSWDFSDLSFKRKELVCLGEEKEIPSPEETGRWQNYKVLVYPNEAFLEAQNYYGVSGVAQYKDQLVLGWVNGIGLVKKEEGKLTSYRPIQIPQEFGIHTVVTQIAPTEQNGIYFGGLDGFVWLTPENELKLIPDPTDITGKLRRVDYFSPYNQGVVAAKEEELYYLEGENIRKWLSPLRNDLEVRDQILGLATGVVDGETVCLAVISVNEGNDWTQWQRHLYRLNFSINPQEPLEVEDLGVIAEFNSQIDKAKLDEERKIFYGKKGTSGDKVVFISLDNLSWEEFKVAEEGRFPIIAELMAGDDGLWVAMEEVLGVYRVVSWNESTRTSQSIAEDLIANPYINTLIITKEGMIFVGHKHLGSQFKKALLTQFVPEKHKVFLPYTTKSR